MQISRIRLSDKTSRLHTRQATPPRAAQAYETEVPVQVREWIGPAPASPELVLVAQPPAQPRSRVGVERPIRAAGPCLLGSSSPSRAARGSTAPPTPWSLATSWRLAVIAWIFSTMRRMLLLRRPQGEPCPPRLRRVPPPEREPQEVERRLPAPCRSVSCPR